MSEFKLCLELERKNSIKLNLSADGVRADRDVTVKIYKNDAIKIKTQAKRKNTAMIPYDNRKKGKISLFCLQFLMSNNDLKKKIIKLNKTVFQQFSVKKNLMFIDNNFIKNLKSKIVFCRNILQFLGFFFCF